MKPAKTVGRTYTSVSAEGTTAGKWGAPRWLMKRARQQAIFSLTREQAEKALDTAYGGDTTIYAANGEAWALSGHTIGPASWDCYYDLLRVSPPPVFYPNR